MQKPVQNDTNSPMYVMGQMVPPGEVVMVTVPDEVEQAQEPADEPTLSDLVLELLKQPVSALSSHLGNATDDALAMMEALEGQAAKPRKSLLSAIGEEKIRRASAALDGTGPDANARADAIVDAKADAGEALAKAIEDLRDNQDPALDAELRAGVLAAEDAARAAGVLVTHIDNGTAKS